MRGLRGDVKQFYINSPQYGDFTAMDFVYSGELSPSRFSGVLHG